MTHGAGLCARLVLALVGFPQATVDISVSVAFAPEEGAARGTERWTRTFGSRTSCRAHSLFGVSMPAYRMVESEEAGRFRFRMEIVLPFVDLVVAYRGVLEPET